MTIITTGFNALTVRFRPERLKRLTYDLLFTMPQTGGASAIILGATRATPFVVKAAVEAGHRAFVVVGGKRVGQEDSIFTKYLIERLAQAKMPLPSNDKITEAEYATEILTEFYHFQPHDVTAFDGDNSQNTQQNLEVLKGQGFDRHAALDVYVLAGMARRLLGTKGVVWEDSRCVVSAHNAYPHGVNEHNWQHDIASAFFLTSEAEKVLSFNDDAPAYERKGFCNPVNPAFESNRILNHVAGLGQASKICNVHLPL